MFKVSVVIPVYNSSRFIDKAVKSALACDEVAEIILVEDGSNDDSLELCYNLKNEFQHKIRVITHENNVNKGAAASRNLGIRNCKEEYIAFLDSDDFYLPERFLKTESYFNETTDSDGIYEAIGTYFYDEVGKLLHEKRMNEINFHQIHSDLTTLTRKVSPENLFTELLVGKCGWFHFNGLTVRRDIFHKSGYLDTEFKLGEDTDLFFRMAITSKLYPGTLDKPVAMRGVYEGNGTLSALVDDDRLQLDHTSNTQLWKKYFELLLLNDFSKAANRFLFYKYLDYFNDKIIQMPINFRRKAYKGFLFYCILFNHPTLIRKIW